MHAYITHQVQPFFKDNIKYKSRPPVFWLFWKAHSLGGITSQFRTSEHAILLFFTCRHGAALLSFFYIYRGVFSISIMVLEFIVGSMVLSIYIYLLLWAKDI